MVAIKLPPVLAMVISITTLAAYCIEAQDLECEAGTCTPTILNHTSSVRISCNYQKLVFINMTETVLTVGTFRLCAKTKSLDLSNNALRTIRAGTFLGLNELTELYLANNQISEIEAGTFHTLTKLEVFVLTGNVLTTLPEYEFTSKHLRFFNVNNNRFQQLPSTALLNLKGIELVDLSLNQLLDLNENALINIDPGATIILSNNKLQNISLNFNTTYTKGVSNVQLNGNMIKILKNSTLGMLHKLRIITLDISFNFIEYIEPGVFNLYESIHSLFLSHNRIEYLDQKAFLGLKYLALLDLSFNKLSKQVFNLQLPDTIRALNYSHNAIDAIDDYSWITHTSKRTLRLHLDHNKISYLDSNRFCSYITWVSLDYNDWTCSFLYNLIQNLSRRLIVVASGFDYRMDNVNGISCNMNAKKIILNASISKVFRKRSTTMRVATMTKAVTERAKFVNPSGSVNSANSANWPMLSAVLPLCILLCYCTSF